VKLSLTSPWLWEVPTGCDGQLEDSPGEEAYTTLLERPWSQRDDLETACGLWVAQPLSHTYRDFTAILVRPSQVETKGGLRSPLGEDESCHMSTGGGKVSFISVHMLGQPCAYSMKQMREKMV
jgi:hypothetical protein